MTFAVVALSLALAISILTNLWMWRINQHARSALVKVTDNIRENYRPNPRTIIVAGDRQQAAHYLRKWGMNPREVLVADNSTGLRGVTDCYIFFCGTWNQRRDIEWINEWLRMQRAVGYVHAEVHVPEPFIRPR